MHIFHLVIVVVAVLLASCVGHRTYTEQEQHTLARTKTIWVDVRSDPRTLPIGIASTILKVEQDVRGKLTRAGFTIVPERSAADAVLQLAFDFTDRRSRYYQYDAQSIHIGVSLDHKEVGHVLWHGGSVSPPYDVNLANSLLIRYIDMDIQEALFKPKPSLLKKD